MPRNQGTKEQLLIDKTVSSDSKKRRTNLAMAWIDYQKACDSEPPSWTSRAMGLHGVYKKITGLTGKSMNHCFIHS